MSPCVDQLVVAGDVAHAVLGQQVVAPLHLLDGPANAFAAFLGSTTTGVMRCCRPLYWPNSTRLGSISISRTWSGVLRMSTEVMMELMQDDLPGAGHARDQDVGHLGQVGHDRTTGDVATHRHLERITGRRPHGLGRGRGCRTSATSCHVESGTSTPMADFPGMGARMRTSGDAIA